MKAWMAIGMERLQAWIALAVEHPVISAAVFLTTAVLLYVVAGIALTCYYKFGRSNEMKTAERTVMLTFDDGPDPEYTETLLDLLAVNGVRATFFLLAEKADRHPEIVDRMVDEGHKIGLHSANHKNLWLQGPFATRRNFETGLGILKNHGWEISCFRPPYGNLNVWTLHEMKKYGLPLQLWSVMAQDWRADHTAEVILSKLRRRTRDGSVICLHDSGEGAAAPGQPERMLQALEVFLPQMKRRGFRFVLPGEPSEKPNGGTVYRNALQRRAGGIQG